MLLRLASAALLVCALFAAAPAANADPICLGLSSGGSCAGYYSSCAVAEHCTPEEHYVCVGAYDGACTGFQKP